MKDPICKMTVKDKSIKLIKDGKEYFFCSQYCKEEFIKRNLPSCCNTTLYKKNIFFENKLLVILTLITILIFLSLFFKFLVPFREIFIVYLKKIWWAIILGLLISGIIDYFVPSLYISKILAERKILTVLNSVILGFFLSSCSHGILAIAIQLHKKGASNFSIVSFLLASPWANFPVTVMLVSLFGLKGLIIILLTLIIAINTGLIFMFLEDKNIVEKNKNTLNLDKNFSIKKDLSERIKNFKLTFDYIKVSIKEIFRSIIRLSDVLLWWIILGVFLASLAGAYIPTHFFHKFMAPTVFGLFVTLILAIIIEVCSEGSSPLAFEIYRKSGALGNSFVFLSAGVATDYTEIGLLWLNVGKKVAVWLPIVTIPQVLLFGYILNLIFK